MKFNLQLMYFIFYMINFFRFELVLILSHLFQPTFLYNKKIREYLDCGKFKIKIKLLLKDNFVFEFLKFLFDSS